MASTVRVNSSIWADRVRPFLLVVYSWVHTPVTAIPGRSRKVDKIFSGSLEKKPPKPMPVSIWMWASATVERASATPLRASPLSWEPTVQITFRSSSCSSSSRSVVQRSMRISSSTKPAFRRAAASATSDTAKRPMPSARRTRASSTRPAPWPSPVTTP